MYFKQSKKDKDCNGAECMTNQDMDFCYIEDEDNKSPSFEGMKWLCSSR